MRLLYLWTDHVGRRALERTLRAGRRRGEGIHERQHLSLRRVSKHRRGNSECAAKHEQAEGRMKIFELTRADNPGQAIAAAAKANTAQQGADIRFIAGGTNLVDYMKLNVETPRQLVDVNHLPFDKIENLPDGGLKIVAVVGNSDL